jgi:hypothetical protein
MDRVTGILLTTFFLASVFSPCVLSTQEPIENKINTRIDIELVSATDFNINATIDVIEITVFDHVYNSIGIQNIASSDPLTLGAIMLRLRDLLKKQIESSCEHANVHVTNEKPVYQNSVFYDEYTVNLTPSFFEVNQTVDIHDFVNGVLDMGARVNYTINFQAEPGWNNIYTILLPTSISRPYTNGDVNGNRIQWKVENEKGLSSHIAGDLQIQLVNPTTPPSEKENIALHYGLNATKPDSIELEINIYAHEINIEKYDILPPFISRLSVVPSDGIRLFVKNGLVSWNDFHNKTLKPLEQKITQIIENSTFNQTLQLLFMWENKTTIDCLVPYEITHMDNNPPIQAVFTDSHIQLEICGIPAKALFGLINSGAQVNVSQGDFNFGEGFDEIGYPFNGTVYLPEKFYIHKKNIYHWDQSTPIAGEIESDYAHQYLNERIDVTVEIEIRGTDLDLPSFFTGETKLGVSLFLQEKKNYSVIEVPPEFNLPKKISIDYLNADALRLCIEEKVFTSDNVTDFLESEKNLFKARLINLLPGLNAEARADTQVFQKSLQWSGNLAEISANNPVQVVSYAHSAYHLAFHLSFLPPKFEIINQSINFMGLQNQNVTYRMIFPPGTNVMVKDSLDKVDVKNTEGGRPVLELSFDVSESGVSDEVVFKMVPSPLFIVGVFMPCAASFFITIILIIVIYIVRKKRRVERKGKFEKEKEQLEGYENQDYYVPPPPSNR